jgi:hypothetical protein
MKDMTQGSVTRHLLHMASFMVVQTPYLLADLYWVGRLGKEAIAAVGLSGNLMMVVLGPDRRDRFRWKYRPKEVLRTNRINIMKTLAFFIGLLVMLTGLTGVIWPESLMRIAHYSLSPVCLYIAAIVRVAIGFVLFRAAPASRAPRALRVIGVIAVLAGIATALLGVDHAHHFLDWWSANGLLFIRGATMFAVVVGGFIAYATAPRRR